MSEEKNLKEIGEELARVAVSSGMGAKQLQTIYKLTKTKSMVYVQAYLKRQIGRGISGLTGFKKVVDLLEEYEDNKGAFQRIIMYAVMLYDYIEKEPVIDLTIVAEPIVKRVIERHHAVFDGVTIKLTDDTAYINVKTKRRFHGNPKATAMEIERELKRRSEFSNLNLKIWIE